jgi:iron(III) transport system ATP-binding protein
MNILEIKNLWKSYSKNKVILHDISLELKKEDILFLLGPSGCGKSTLLRIIAGLLKEDSGEIILNGEKVNNIAPEKRKTAMVFQNYALWPHLNVFENIAFGLKVAKKSRDFIRDKVAQMLKIIRMEDYANREITSLSGGQQQRIALARALAVNPELLLLDEPLSNLDAKLRESMRNEIRKIIKDNHLTAIYVTHDRNEAMAIADKIAIMREGVIVQQGTPFELYDYPNSEFSAEFMGEVNFFKGSFIEKSSDKFIKISTPYGVLTANNYYGYDYEVDSAVSTAIRIENIKLYPQNNAPEIDNLIVGRLSEFCFMGDRGEYLFELADGKNIRVAVSPFVNLEVGESYCLHLPAEKLVVVKE